jgi:tRNA (mo5U34)-methyltransferase
MMSTDELKDAVVRLGPWHLDIAVTPEISTRVWADTVGERIASPRERFQKTLLSIYPDGLQQRSVLDCGCNAGGYSFWAKELGAGTCFGFDAREQWIRQARFLLKHRGEQDMRFEVADLYHLPELDPFDVTVFSGLFYHLPDPVTGLKIAADLTKEVILVMTATKTGAPDGYLAVETESLELPLSGIYGLNWRPTGPRAIDAILHWLGFPDVRLLGLAERPSSDWGLMHLAAARTPGLLRNVATGWPKSRGE